METGRLGLSGSELRGGGDDVETGLAGAGVVGAGIEAGDFVLSCAGIGAGGLEGTVTGAAAWTFLPAQPEHKNGRDAATTHTPKADTPGFGTRRMGQNRGRVESGLAMK